MTPPAEGAVVLVAVIHVPPAGSGVRREDPDPSYTAIERFEVFIGDRSTRDTTVWVRPFDRRSSLALRFPDEGTIWVREDDPTALPAMIALRALGEFPPVKP